MSLTSAGRVGIRAVLEVIRVASRLERLTLADNWLNNDSVKEVVGVIGTSNLHFLDLSRNPISHSAGKVLSDYAGRNRAIYSILLDGTLINPALIRIIHQKADTNRAKACVDWPPASDTAVAAPQPPSQPPPEQRSRPHNIQARQPPKALPPQGQPQQQPARPQGAPLQVSTGYSGITLLSAAAPTNAVSNSQFISLLHEATAELNNSGRFPSFGLLMQVSDW